MEDLINWFATNKTWIFSGAGVAIIVGAIAFFRNRGKKKSEGITTNVITGDNNTQAGRDVNNTNIYEVEKKSP